MVNWEPRNFLEGFILLRISPSLPLSLSLSRSTKLFFSGLSLLFRRVRVSEVFLLQRRGGSPGLEIYNEHESTEKYLIQSTKSSPHSTPKAPEEIEGMDNEVAPEFIVDQGLCYSTGNNFYGYYCTGFESPNEWDDHRTFFGVDGPDLNYTGLQTESLPYVYYTPSYGYAQSPYNPYNPYIPGATVGTDSSFVGTQQYYTGPNFQPNVSSSPYFPLVVQSRPDIVPNISPDSSLLSTGASKTNKPNGPGSKQTLSSASARTTPAPPRPALGDVKVEPALTSLNQAHSSAKISEGSKANVAPSKQPVAHGVVTSGSSPHLASSHVTQGRFASGSIQAADYSSLGRVSSPRSSLKVALPVSNGLSDFGTRGWSTVEKLRPRMHYGGVLNYVNGSPEVLGEQNRGPRTNRSKSQWAPSFSVKAYTTKAGASNAQGDITIYANQYNKDDFPVNFADAKFFVIKSYSEDDVHKSIKYNVWSSTPNGNKRLDGAYEDAQRIAAGKPRGCPIFLFFSVNASGQFCGVAEMIGPVDFCKDMDFWQQDKWSGSFPVKWHIIKDVPNTNFRHIILENNENKPVTNSRDTQEIRYKQGMEMLNIFKNYTSKTSMLDDFMFYEDRQKIMHEEKARLSKSYDGSYFIPTLVPPKPIGGVDLPLKAEEKPSIDDDLNSLGKTVASTSEQAPSKSDANSSSSNANVSANHNLVEDVNDITPVLKIGSLTINPKQAEFEPSELTAEQDDVVTIGSMPVKVNGFGCSSGILTVGTIPLDPKKLELDRAGVFSAAGNPF